MARCDTRRAAIPQQPHRRRELRRRGAGIAAPGDRPGEHRRGYIRDALAEAFAQGELQGEYRALWVLAIAHRNAQSPATKAALVEVVQLLAPDVAATWEET
jgi:hypothetical protein